MAANPTTPLESLSGTVAGRFRILERLGQGGMGEVYRAEDLRLKRFVALKRLPPHLRADPVYRQRLLTEAERASRLNDPHVAAVYDVLEHEGEIFLVLEYVEGETLRRRLQNPLTIEEFLQVAIQCAEALAGAHHAGIVHCDIKPENIMLTPAGRVKVLDFGIAKRLPRSDQSSTLHQTRPLSGTPAYMAPEVLIEGATDGRADIFSLGVVFYEALTGHHPFAASSFVATADLIRQLTPAPLSVYNPRVPRALQLIVQKMLAKEPAQRYQSGEELSRELRNLCTALTPATQHSLLVRPRERSMRLRWSYVTVISVVIAAVVGAAVWPGIAHRRGQASAQPAVHLAVLPFSTTGNDRSAQAFCDGLSETLVAKLTRLSSDYPLHIVPLSEVRAESIQNAEHARRSFGVKLVVEGNLQEAGGKVRVNYSLVDAETLRQVAADTITVDRSDVFAVQDRVVGSIVSMLGLHLQAPQRSELVAHGTQEPAAYDYYLRGRGYLQDYHKPENVSSAIAVFQRALERDPNYALAYAGLGEAYWAKYQGSDDAQWVAQALEACNKAIRLAPSEADGHVCAGTVDNGTGKYERAVEEFRRASELDPTSADAVRGLAFAYQHLGKPQEAEETYRRAIQLRPQYWAGYDWLGTFYGNQARYAEAAQQFSQVIALAPDDPHGYRKLGGVYIFMGNYEKAIQALQTAIRLSPTPEAYSNLGVAYFNQRRFEDAVVAYGHACRPGAGDFISCGNLGRAYYWAPGKRSQAEPFLRQSIQLAGERLKVNPRDGDALILLASDYAMLADKAQALKNLKAGLSVAPEEPEYLVTAAMVHNDLGNKEESLNWLAKAVSRGYSRAEILVAPEFDNLRGEAEARGLLRSN